MRSLSERILAAFLTTHHGVITREQALGLGLTERQIDAAVASGRWVRLHRGVYGRVGTEATVHGALLAAIGRLGPSAVASHQSAAHLWQLIDRPPARPSLTVPEARRRRVPGVDVHRSTDLDRSTLRWQRSVPLTDVARTLVDLGSVASPNVLDLAVDRARAARLVTIDSLSAEIDRLARRGRPGPPALRAALERRGLVEAPNPSVLESRMTRLFTRWGITVLGFEHVVLDGRYRLDYLLRHDLSLEVDGFAFHSSPEAKAADARRRADLAAIGIQVIEADWVLVTRRPAELRFLIERALALPARSA